MIKVEPDIFDAEFDVGEPCCICGCATRFWFTPKDVACCPSCAEFAAAKDIPCKRDWLNANLQPGQTPLPPEWPGTAQKVFRGGGRTADGKFRRSA